MASRIRIPKTTERLLPHCKPYHNKLDAYLFKSYAAMVAFAACYGFKCNPDADDRLLASNFLKAPEPIDYAIFKSNDHHEEFLILALYKHKKTELLEDVDVIIKIVESYAHIGGAHLQAMLDENGETAFVDEIVNEVLSHSI